MTYLLEHGGNATIPNHPLEKVYPLQFDCNSPLDAFAVYWHVPLPACKQLPIVSLGDLNTRQGMCSCQLLLEYGTEDLQVTVLHDHTSIQMEWLLWFHEYWFCTQTSKEAIANPSHAHRAQTMERSI